MANFQRSHVDTGEDEEAEIKDNHTPQRTVTKYPKAFKDSHPKRPSKKHGSDSAGQAYLDLSRVAKCHGYGGYIRVKNWKVGVKSLGEQTVLQNQVLFG